MTKQYSKGGASEKPKVEELIYRIICHLDWPLRDDESVGEILQLINNEVMEAKKEQIMQDFLSLLHEDITELNPDYNPGGISEDKLILWRERQYKELVKKEVKS